VDFHTNVTNLSSRQGISVNRCKNRLVTVDPGPEGLSGLLKHSGQRCTEQIVQGVRNSGLDSIQLLNLPFHLSLGSCCPGSVVCSMFVSIPKEPQLMPFLENERND
jgi:hypothetical protein